MPFAATDDGARIAYYAPSTFTSTVPSLAFAGGPGADQRYLQVGGGFARIAERRSIVFLDQRGSGRSSPDTPSDSIERLVEDLEAVRAALEAPRIDLIGHSFGAYLAFAYAAKYEARVRSLVLVGAMAPRAADTQQLFEQVFPDRIGAWRDTRARLPDLAPAPMLDLFHSMEFVRPEAGRHYTREVAGHVYNFRLNNRLRRDMEGLDYTAYLSRCRRPALVLHGRWDAIIAPVVGWALHRLIPDSRFVAFEESGHSPFVEEPDAFARAVTDFLAEIDAGETR